MAQEENQGLGHEREAHTWVSLTEQFLQPTVAEIERGAHSEAEDRQGGWFKPSDSEHVP